MKVWVCSSGSCGFYSTEGDHLRHRNSCGGEIVLRDACLVAPTARALAEVAASTESYAGIDLASRRAEREARTASLTRSFEAAMNA